MEAREYKLGKIIILELKGRVDEFNTGVLGDEIKTIIKTGRLYVIIDLINTNFLSADCLREIWACNRWIQKLGGEIVLNGAQASVLEAINYVSFDLVTKRFYEIAEAVAYLEQLALAPRKQGKKSSFRISFSHIIELLRRLNIKEIWHRILKVFFICLLIIASQGKAASEIRNNKYSLDEILSLAREISPGIRLARLKMLEKDAEVKLAQSWGLPKVAATTGYMYESNPSIISEVFNKEINNIHNPGDELNPQALKSRTRLSIKQDSALFGFGFSQLVYSGGLFEHQVSLREAQKREADVQISLEMLDVEDQVRNLFIGLLLTKEKLKYLQTHSEAISQRKQAALKAFDVKIIGNVQLSEIELLEFKANHEQLGAEKDEQSMRGLLNLMINRQIDLPLEPLPLDINQDFKLETTEHYFEIALHRYPELKRNMALMDSASAYEKIVNSQGVLSPQAMVFGDVKYTYGLGETSQDLSWSAGFGMYIPLYDGRKTSAELEKAMALSSQARLSFEAAERKLQISINEVVAEIRKSQLQQKLAQKVLELSSKKKQEAQDAVAQGQLPSYRMSEVLAQEMEAKISLIAAQAEFYKWYSKLLLLTGQKV